MKLVKTSKSKSIESRNRPNRAAIGQSKSENKLKELKISQYRSGQIGLAGRSRNKSENKSVQTKISNCKSGRVEIGRNKPEQVSTSPVKVCVSKNMSVQVWIKSLSVEIC